MCINIKIPFQLIKHNKLRDSPAFPMSDVPHKYDKIRQKLILHRNFLDMFCYFVARP